MGVMLELWREEPRARPYFVALAQGSLATGAAYVAVMLVAYARLGSAWAAVAILLAQIAPGMLAGPLIGAWVDRHDSARCAVLAEAVRGAALAAMIVVGGKAPLVALALVTGLASTALRPAAFALLPTVVAPERRMAATALWSAAQDLGMTLGPALAAAVLVLGGPTLLLALTAGLLACGPRRGSRASRSWKAPGQLVPAHMLGRVHALGGTIESWGLAGAALLGGTVASVLGARGVFALGGLALLAIAAVAGRALLRPAVRPALQPNPT